MALREANARAAMRKRLGLEPLPKRRASIVASAAALSIVSAAAVEHANGIDSDGDDAHEESKKREVDDEEDGIEVDLYIDDGFVLRIHFERNPNDLDNEEYSFEYGNQYEYRDKDPKIVAGLIDKFLKLIGRSDMEHGMNLDDLKLMMED